jgi:hypothetical protein
LENDFQVDVEGISDEHILHSAVGILRRDIEKLKISVEDYPKRIIFQLRGFKFGLVFIASPKESLSLKTIFDIPWPR